MKVRPHTQTFKWDVLIKRQKKMKGKYEQYRTETQ